MNINVNINVNISVNISVNINVNINVNIIEVCCFRVGETSPPPQKQTADLRSGWWA